MNKIIFATRPSALARWQTQAVIAALQARLPGLVCVEQVITTQGDRILNMPLPEIGGKGLFTDELEAAILAGQVDCAVHSLKDLPVISAPDLCIGCIPERGEVRDVLVSARGYTLETLPSSATVGTSSLRRAAQILHLRPDLKVQSLRGNVDTRLRKAMEGMDDAILLAGAGLVRLSLEKYISQWLPLSVMLPAPGQGALAVQCRRNDTETLAVLAELEDPATRTAVTAERAFLQELGGGCAAPVAAFASLTEELHLTGLVASPDGRRLIRLSAQGGSAQEIGARMAREALRQGAAEILQQVVLKDAAS